jgi:LmbE family N-acetylglucosaminyl deacetylase
MSLKNVLVIAPHPDDETLGCGGTLLKHKQDGDDIHWLIMTGTDEQSGHSKEWMDQRSTEIEAIGNFFNFSSTHQLPFITATLDTVSLSDMIGEIKKVLDLVQPHIVYLPFQGDAHSDHKVTFNASASALKWFRAPSVESIRVYETPSETEVNIDHENSNFNPNQFIEISPFLDQKIAALKVYESEFNEFPFPRSEHMLRSLAAFRGSSCGVDAAEAFMIMREVHKTTSG